jgi:hypothetical protein
MLEIIPVKMFMTGAQSNKHEHCSNCRYAKSLSKNKPKKESMRTKVIILRFSSN